ncbi:hypothetical protein P691DRAFT_728597 [Macrolepiota fuliginosa MF-IS2]|uniref:Ribosomal RNA-processing protein 43 n=1 Tax=Macrolepiota fuliginosa MF-IS2 TaxID=1400762 RepID=A0A9P6C4Q7_9AGAR|nr:hypothetical protein P691DRAFT_728597 [Macrolepiota fuliginosa MF-IS2]
MAAAAAVLSTSPAPSASVSNAPEQGSDTLKAAIFQRLHPRVYLERFLAEDVRPDGRALGTGIEGGEGVWRDVSINVGSISTADGSALVRMGGTTIVCGVKAEIAEPDLERPDEGFLVPNVDLPAMCHPKFKPGPPSDEAQVLSERLFETLISSNFIKPQSLIIHPGRAAWTLYVDATCINYDGNVFDATLLAMITALMNTKLPKATYNEDTNQTTCYHQPKTLLTTNGLPLSISFGIFDSTRVLADPTAFEEPLLDSTISIVVGEREGRSAGSGSGDVELLSVVQQGLGAVSGARQDSADDVLSACISAGKKRRLELARIVREAVGADSVEV